MKVDRKMSGSSRNLCLLVATSLVAFILWVPGCAHRVKVGVLSSGGCVDKTVKILDSEPGTDPEVVLMCAAQNNHITWDGGGKHFTVHFDEWQFEGSPKDFDDGANNNVSPKPKKLGWFSKYKYVKYTVTVQTPDGPKTFDPGVIITP